MNKVKWLVWCTRNAVHIDTAMYDYVYCIQPQSHSCVYSFVYSDTNHDRFDRSLAHAKMHWPLSRTKCNGCRCHFSFSLHHARGKHNIAIIYLDVLLALFLVFGGWGVKQKNKVKGGIYRTTKWASQYKVFVMVRMVFIWWRLAK